MSMYVIWDEDDKATLRYTVTGRWTWAEFYAARDQARRMADGVTRDKLNSIIDIRDGSLFPQNALSHLRRMPDEAHPKLKGGTVVIVHNNLFVRSLMDIMRHLNGQAMQNFHSARTLEEARTRLIKAQQPATASV